ncbi:TetR/AcrR family transcriptional regulator [Euzebya sp.]|uniref:TetR/AcrR family transcriptional regulator n=1 Tax=Euzebya sp. TaxID=1971409 RepID=UPI003513AF49
MSASEEASVRRLPEQGRSRARVERILDVAAELIATTGVDAMTMSGLAEAAEVSLPSVYRYFPSKQAIVATLVQRYAARVREQLAATMTPPSSRAGARAALGEAMRAYWALYRSDPAFAAVWSAAVADPALVDLDVQDSRRNGALLASALRGVVDDDAADDLDRLAFLASHLAGAVVRLGVLLDADEADALVGAVVDRVLPALLGVQGEG